MITKIWKRFLIILLAKLKMFSTFLPLLAIVLFVVSPLRTAIEQTLFTHVLIEYPIYIVLGLYLGKTQNKFFKISKTINHGGIPGILVATFTLAFWMIPRWMDTCVSEPEVALIRAVTLTYLVGVSLAVSWPIAHIITRSLIKIELLATLFRMGWIYQISPERLCNNYLISDQIILGSFFIYLGYFVAAYWLIEVFFGLNFNKFDTKVCNTRKYLPKKHF